MILGARPLAIGPLATNWTPFVVVEFGWSAGAALQDASTMATYNPSPIPAGAQLSDIALTWTINPSVATVPVYRCVIDSPTLGALTVPMKNFQGTMKIDTAGFLSVSIPDVLRWIDAIEPLLVDASMAVYKGDRFADGSEQLEAIAWADFPLRLRSDLGVESSTITLSGYHEFDPTAAKTRSIGGVNYRRSDEGRRVFRCELDTFLRPGDTAELLSETIVVSDINYTVGAGQERMEIAEDNSE